jgi:hypothetical protein
MYVFIDEWDVDAPIEAVFNWSIKRAMEGLEVYARENAAKRLEK